MRPMMCVLAVFMLLLPVALFGQWTVSVMRAGAEIPFEFGTDASGTDGYDMTLDGASPPAPPSGFYGYFPLSDTLFPMIDKLFRDIRGISDTVDWQFYANWIGGSNPETLTWNPSALPSSYGVIYMDTLADFSTATDMSTFSSFVLDHYPMTIYWRFIAGTPPEDTIPPYTENWYPGCGVDDVPVDVDSISVDVLDAMSGVDETSITITVMGFDVTMLATITAISGGYHIAYHPPTSLPYGASISIVLDANDNMGNALHEECTFTTEDTTAIGYTLSGFVYDTAGVGISGAAIIDASLTFAGTSDDSGYYEITNIPDGSYLFNCTATGYDVVSDSITISGADVVHNFILTPAAVYITISGTVTDSATGDPLEDAIVTATWGSGSADDTTGSDGTYSITDLPGGTPLMLVAEHADYYSDSVFGSYSGDETIDFALAPIAPETYTVSGTITLEGETDYSGTEVVLSDVGTTYTDALGAYNFADVSAGTYTLTATHTGFVSLDTTFDVVDADVVINAELAAESELSPPRNLSATEDYAWYIFINWEEPLEPGVYELTYDDGDLPGSYYPMGDYDVYSVGVLFQSPVDGDIFQVRAAFADSICPPLTCSINSTDGTDIPGDVLATSSSSEFYDDFWVYFDYSTPVPISSGDYFFVQLDGDDSYSFGPMIDIVDGSGYGDYAYFNYMDTWVTLAEGATDGEDHIWLVRVEINTGSTVYSVAPTGLVYSDGVGNTFVRQVFRNSSEDYLLGKLRPLKDNRFIPAVDHTGRVVDADGVRGMRRTTAPMDVTGYKLYRSETPFTSTGDPGVEMIYETTADTTWYLDTEVEPEIMYYYGVTAVYLDGESPLSSLDSGMALEINPPAQILIFDWAGGDSLAEGGDADEAQALYEYLLFIGVPAESIYVSEQDEIIQHFYPYTDYISYYDDKRYSTIFWITGVWPAYYFTYGSHADSIIWLEFMDYGGNLYIEGVDFAWYMIDQEGCPTIPWRMGVDFYHDGWFADTTASSVTDSSGNVEELTIVDPSFFGDWTEFTMGYQAQTIADMFVDVLEPFGTGEALMRSQLDVPDSVGDGVRMVFNDDGVAKTVLSSIYFGSIIDGLEYPELKSHILGGILNAFGIPNTYTREKPSAKPEIAVLLGNSPNPFNAATAISFELTQTSTVKLDVLDISGRNIATLTDANLTAGTHTLIWNGRDALGNDVPSGIYTYRLTVGNATISGRMVLVR